MPFATITGGSQTADVQYGYGTLNRIQAMSGRLIPAGRIAEMAKAGQTGGAEFLSALAPEEIATMLLGQLENQVEIVKLVLLQVREGDKVVYTKGKDSASEFVDLYLDPELGQAVALHLLNTTKGGDEVVSPNSETGSS